MTLSRLLDPRDRDLLIVVAVTPTATPSRSASSSRRQVSPATRSTSCAATRPPVGTPNGLIEFLVAETIAELREHRAVRGLGIHFATMRAVLAGDAGDRFWHRSIARLMLRLSADMQIESLWRFNAKFDPRWLPRYRRHRPPAVVAPRRPGDRPARIAVGAAADRPPVATGDGRPRRADGASPRRRSLPHRSGCDRSGGCTVSHDERLVAGDDRIEEFNERSPSGSKRWSDRRHRR